MKLTETLKEHNSLLTRHTLIFTAAVRHKTTNHITIIIMSRELMNANKTVLWFSSTQQ